jgi:hypothetical protein
MRAFHPEDKARSAIDARFVACGWLVQSRDEMNLSAGTGVAVREFAKWGGGRMIGATGELGGSLSLRPGW